MKLTLENLKNSELIEFSGSEIIPIESIKEVELSPTERKTDCNSSDSLENLLQRLKTLDDMTIQLLS